MQKFHKNKDLKTINLKSRGDEQAISHNFSS